VTPSILCELYSGNLEHGNKPKGFGCWAFKVPDYSRDEVLWVNQCTLAECRKRLLAQVNPTRDWGVIEAIVLP
jgi:hypothetical protein